MLLNRRVVLPTSFAFSDVTVRLFAPQVDELLLCG